MLLTNFASHAMSPHAGYPKIGPPWITVFRLLSSAQSTVSLLYFDWLRLNYLPDFPLLNHIRPYKRLPGALCSTNGSLRSKVVMLDPNPTLTVHYGRNINRADVPIIGAGLSGMTTATDMIRKGNGRNFIIAERGNQVEGAWNDQRYPGCCYVCSV